MAIQRTVTRIALSLIVALACASGASANEGSSADSTSSATTASASLGFRIVIPEVLRLEGPAQPQHVAAAQTARVLTTLDDRQLVTLVRP